MIPKKINFILAVLTLFFGQFIYAQEKEVSGTVKDEDGKALPGVNITVEGTDSGTQTDFDGNYTIDAEVGQTLKFSYVGFQDHKETVGDSDVIDVVMTSGSELEEVVVLGSRAGARSKMESAVPVDAFSLEKTASVTPQTSVSSILNQTSPSFSSTTHSGMDATDHVDPAQIRGMGPDQTLVLLNGKRRHTSALVNVNGSTGRGTVATDLNAIPSFALNNIEVLRDGAAAQYGSDAIAGVMNLEMKKNTDGLSGQISYGGHLTSRANDHSGDWDGDQVQADLNYGTEVGQRGGFINLTGSFKFRGRTHRAGVRTGQLYDAYNAIAGRAREDGEDLNSYFSNINQLEGIDEGQFVGLIHQYAQDVDYFDSDFQNEIQNANSISGLQGLLGKDITDKEIDYRGLNRRDFNMDFGQSKTNNSQFFVNSEFPVSDDWTIYAFGGYSFRHGSSGAFYRKPFGSNNYPSMYPNGFLPFINSDIHDFSISAGIKGKWGEWNMDFSNTLGQNDINLIMDHTANVTMGLDSPKHMKAGGFSFLQNTMNLDFDRDFDVFESLNLAFGAEYRHENFKIKTGDKASYETYDINGNPFDGTTERPTDFFGEVRPGLSQGFGGFSPDNAADEGRDSFALYADAAVDFTDWLLVDGALRYEHYSDFGNTLNFKLASRIKLTDDLNFRLAGSTGFRAPSMAQIYYNSTSTFFTNNQVKETGTFRNDSKIADLLGIPDLDDETSVSLSTGFTYKIPSSNINITVDGYWTKVKDRVLLTGDFSKPSGDDLSDDQKEVRDIFDDEVIESARFFANAINTETRGIDVVFSHNYDGDKFSITNDLGFNINKTKRVGAIHASDLLRDAGLVDSYFDEPSRIYVEEATPNIKINLTNNMSVGKFDIFLRNNYYGKTTDPNDLNADDPDAPIDHMTNKSQVVTDLALSYNFNEQMSFTLGANNIFDIYPTRAALQNSNDDQFRYSSAVSQFGFNGRYVFAKLNFQF